MNYLKKITERQPNEVQKPNILKQMKKNFAIDVRLSYALFFAVDHIESYCGGVFFFYTFRFRFQVMRDISMAGPKVTNLRSLQFMQIYHLPDLAL